MLLRDELGIGEKDLKPYVARQFSDDDLTAPPASGSNRFDAFVIIPASTSTIGKIASGIGDTLITRTAQVCLKERYKLILCVRETPLSTLTLEQCARLSGYGATIMPISPPLYFVPKTVDDYIGAFTDKVLAQIGGRTRERVARRSSSDSSALLVRGSGRSAILPGTLRAKGSSTASRSRSTRTWRSPRSHDAQSRSANRRSGLRR